MKLLLFFIWIFQAEVLFGRSIKDRLKKGIFDKLILFETRDKYFMANKPQFPVKGITGTNDDKMTYIDKEQELFVKMKMLFDEFMKN